MMIARVSAKQKSNEYRNRKSIATESIYEITYPKARKAIGASKP